MTALNSLVRVHRWILDEKRQKLADLERLLDSLRQDLGQLDAGLQRERQAAEGSFEATCAYPPFLAAVRERRKKLDRSIANLERERDASQEEISDAFRELKKYETARDSATQRAVTKRNRREQLAMDDMAIGMYRRRAAGE